MIESPSAPPVTMDHEASRCVARRRGVSWACATATAWTLQASAAFGQGIHDVDFRDRVWTHTCAGTVRTRGGSWTGRRTMGGREWFGVDEACYGDLDGDGVDEAVVVTACGGGGSGVFSEGVVFAWRDGRAREIARLGQGDRADGGIVEVRIDGGEIIERRAITQHGALDYEYIATMRRALRGGRLTFVAPATIECDDEHRPDCTLPAAQPAAVAIVDDLLSTTRIVTFDANGALPTLSVEQVAGDSLAVTAWCVGTDLTQLRVQSPSGAITEATPIRDGVLIRSTEAGRYEVTVHAAHPVGLCFTMFWARNPP